MLRTRARLILILAVATAVGGCVTTQLDNSHDRVSAELALRMPRQPRPAADPPAIRPVPRPPSIVRDVAYGPRPEQRLDLYLPDERAFGPDRPVIVWVHGGGWMNGSRADVPDYILWQRARAGFAIASVDYALSPQHRFPVAVQDVKRSIRWLKANANRWDLDPSRIVVAGLSAGGHLAALTGASAGSLEPTDLPPDLAAHGSGVVGVVDIIGPTDLETYANTEIVWAHEQVSAFLGCDDPGYPSPIVCPAGVERAASVAPYLDASDPPAYFIYGGADPLVRVDTQGLPIAWEWLAATPSPDMASRYEIVEGVGHDLNGEHMDVPALEKFLDSL